MKKIAYLFFLLISLSVSAQDMELINSLQKKLAAQKNDTDRIMTINDIAWQYRVSDMNRSISMADSALQLSIKINFMRGISKGYILKGVYYTIQGEYDSAAINYEQCRIIRERQGDSSGVAAVLHDLGNIQLYKGNYDKSLNYYLSSLRLEEKYGSVKNIAETYVNIGNVYLAMKKIDEALKNYFKYLSLQKDSADGDAICEVYTNIGSAYFQQGKQELSEEYYTKTKELAIKYGNDGAMAMSLSGLGDIYINKNNFKAAESNYLQALELLKSQENIEAVADKYNSLSALYLELSELKKAEVYADSAMEIGKEIGTKKHVSTAYDLLSKIAFRKNDFKKAFEMKEMFTLYNDSILNENTASKVAELQTVYETEKKDAQNELLLKENKIKDLRIEKSFVTQVILIIALLLLLAIGYLIYSRNRSRQRELINETMMKEREARTKEVIEAEERERMRIARDLHDGVGQMLSAAKMNLSNLEGKLQISDGEQKKMMNNSLALVDDSVRELRNVSHNMMPNALIRSGLKKALEEFITKLHHPGMKIDLEVVGLEERLESTMESVLYRVIQEIVSNIIKHAEAKTVSIQLIRHDDELVLMIEDDGKGFDQNKLEEHSGIGIKNIQSRIAYLNGSVSFDSTLGRGTTVSVSVPC